MITHKELLKRVYYNPEIGVFITLGRLYGKRLGTTRGRYSKITFGPKNKNVYSTHRLAWFYVYGEWPNIIDHIDGNTFNNKLSNLRNVTSTINSQNRKEASPNNKVKLLGVVKTKYKFRAKIIINGKHKHLGMFSTAEEAHAAYITAKRKYHEGCTI